MGEPTKKFTMAGVLGVAVAAATVGGAVVAGIGEYRQSLQAAREDHQAKEQASKAEYPLVKVVMPGEHKPTVASEETDLQDQLIMLLTKQLGVIRNYGNGPALNVTLKWTGIDGENFGQAVLSPMADLAPEEFAEFCRLPQCSKNWLTDEFQIEGYLHLTYTDLSGKRHATKQRFEILNAPGMDPGLRTVIVYPTKDNVYKPHTHIR